MNIEKQVLINVLKYANELWNEKNEDRSELVITFSGLPVSDLIPLKSVIAKDSIESSSDSFDVDEIGKIRNPVTKISIDLGKLGFPAVDVSGTIKNYCEKLRDGFIYKDDIQIIRSPLIVSYADNPSDVLKSINIKKDCFDLIGNLSDDKSTNLLFYANDILRIDNYSFSYELCENFELNVAIDFLDYFNHKEDNYVVKSNCFKEELLDVLHDTEKECRCLELFRYLDEILINTKARVGRYIRRTSEASINAALKEISEKFLPMLSASIQTLTADILALVGNIVLLSNINFENILSVSNIVFILISGFFDLIFSFILHSRQKNLTLICEELLETEKELKEFNPKDIKKISKQIGKLKAQANNTKKLFRVMLISIWIPIIIALFFLYILGDLRIPSIILVELVG